MSVGLLFSGQGTQHPQMLNWLDDSHPLLRQMTSLLGVSNWRQALDDPTWATRNRHAQVLLTGVALTAWAQLSAGLPTPAAIAGYSVGELAAFAAAGVFDADIAMALAVQRAEAMDRAAAQSPGGLAAVGGLGAPAVAALCRATGAAVAIRIAADTVVLGGSTAALMDAEPRALELGAKWSPLKVGLASHTPAMSPAAQAFATVLAGMALKRPTTPLFSNTDAGRIFTAEQAARALATQIAQPVQWSGCLEAVHARQPACVLEVGPGSALAAMWNRRYPEVPARSCDEFRSARAVIDWVARLAR
ncbi:acyltransferase domain-containing protein [Aquincola sp. S2]|uniref:Acyltransferase domain-containing protein n=1 Tax=Pseudaquabacterium terrae TaxID=2732868 RepID=A0ABX2EQF4_9BURK|nr:acyltransferase domain-containing protein [Aquabacterium terrae]NRF70751.1 acyltransferase domain-containing protein [Aquabacterium terrae]